MDAQSLDELAATIQKHGVLEPILFRVAPDGTVKWGQISNLSPQAHDIGLFRDEKYPVAERIARQGLYRPSGLTLTEDQLDQVCNAVRKILK